jgi:hypothetical protein
VPAFWYQASPRSNRGKEEKQGERKRDQEQGQESKSKIEITDNMALTQESTAMSAGLLATLLFSVVYVPQVLLNYR